MSNGWTVVSLVWLLSPPFILIAWRLGYIENADWGFWVQNVLMTVIGFVIGIFARTFEEKNAQRFGRYLKEIQDGE